MTKPKRTMRVGAQRTPVARTALFDGLVRARVIVGDGEGSYVLVASANHASPASPAYVAVVDPLREQHGLSSANLAISDELERAVDSHRLGESTTRALGELAPSVPRLHGIPLLPLLD
jgi:hypothetical protein